MTRRSDYAHHAAVAAHYAETANRPRRRQRDVLGMLDTIADYPVTDRMRVAALACLRRHGCEELAGMLGLEVAA